MSSFKSKVAKYIGSNRHRLLLKLLYSASKKYNNYYENKNYDQHTNGEFWLMKQLSNLNMTVVFDVGANTGLWTLQANKMFPKAQIYSFEPIPTVFEKLKDSASDFKNIHVANLGLSETKGEAKFLCYTDHDDLGTMYGQFDSEVMTTVECQLIRGGTYCDENQIDQIDFLKIDTEGAEMNVLQGFSEMLIARKIRIIQFEYNELSILSHFLLRDFYLFFEQFGYQLGKLYPNYVEFAPYHWDREDFIGPNYVAIQTDDKQLFKQLT